MKAKKIFILLPDGIGLRNFAFTSFVEKGREQGWNIVFWNSTPFDLSTLGLSEIKLKAKPSFLTDLFKRTRKNIELDLFEKKFRDKVYRTYEFSPSTKGIKAKVKNLMVTLFTSLHSGESGLGQLRKRIKASERRTTYYKECVDVLKIEQPDLVFCTNQRPVIGIAPLVAAGDLGIPTATFIFSWDNLPKATMVVESNYYFVWSDHMKEELQKYYQYIFENQIIVSGSPQFEHHFDKKNLRQKEDFYNQYELDSEREYLCFSGDDLTTSPHDQIYLRDMAIAVRKLNEKGENIGIIFRRSPVDFSDRYNKIIKEFLDVIVPIAPAWEMTGEAWDTVLPTKKDLEVQRNIIENTFMVINLGSSMVFDYVSYNKPCAYINYNPDVKDIARDVSEIYDYVHFRSMPSTYSVFWINSPDEVPGLILKILNGGNDKVISSAKEWFQIINKVPHSEASQRIWEGIEKIKKECI